jgi:hypothetical protein
MLVRILYMLGVQDIARELSCQKLGLQALVAATMQRSMGKEERLMDWQQMELPETCEPRPCREFPSSELIVVSLWQIFQF